jgi:hypothetical protein
LLAVQAAMRAEMASRLTLRGLPRLLWWINAMASSVNRGSGSGAAGELEVAANVSGGFLVGHAGHVAAHGDPLLERSQGSEPHLGGQGGLAKQDCGEWDSVSSSWLVSNSSASSASWLSRWPSSIYAKDGINRLMPTLAGGGPGPGDGGGLRA